MKKIVLIFISFIALSCKTTQNSNKSEVISQKVTTENSTDFVITFGSCNKPDQVNSLWDDVARLNPDMWIWGGDIIYADTNDMDKMKADYELQKQQKGYDEIVQKTKILGTWDDHDFGQNNAGVEYLEKKTSQKLLLDFLSVDENSSRRDREGVYHSEVFNTAKGSVKVILLDTRYFRTGITKAEIQGTQANRTILGTKQWAWLNNELENSNADFNVIMSSIQVIAEEHPYEKWNNFPKEREKFLDMIVKSKAENVILLSGDRHISEFSKIELDNLEYPLIDFTSSGLTHASKNFTKEYNPARTGKVVHTLSFGALKFDFDTKKVTMQMRGNNDQIQQEITQVYP